MDTVLCLLVFSALPLIPAVPTVTSFRATVEIVSETSRIFSGENLQLRCSLPESNSFSWTFQWFKGSQQLPQSGQIFKLWKAKITESGKFSCQGVRDSMVGSIKTQRSLPVEISVDGGWAILEVSPQPGLAGDTLKLTCRLRQKFPIHETVLYRDGIEIMRQNGRNLDFFLTNVTIKDNGMYSCRASFDINLRTLSVISGATRVHILEVLSEPLLEIDADNDLIRAEKMKLICHVQYNARAPAPPVHYYFYRDGNRLGTATSENHDLVRRTPGSYSCRAKVPKLDLSRWSEPKRYGRIPEPPMQRPRPHPRSHLPLPIPKLSQEHFLPATAQPTAASSASPPSWHADETAQSSESPLKTSLPVTSSMPPSTKRFSYQNSTQRFSSVFF